MTDESVESLRTQIESIGTQITEIKGHLRLMEEEKSKFVFETDIPMQLKLEEPKKRIKLEKLLSEKKELEKQLSQRETTPSLAHTADLLSPSGQKLKVYISSTSVDLEEYRAVARAAILEAKWLLDMKPNFGPKTEHSVAACEILLQECDLVILLFAFQLGYVPAKNQGGNGSDSITVFELDCARKHGKDVLIFLAAENEHWSYDADREGINNFRKKLGKPAGVFEYEESADTDSDILPKFRGLVRTALSSYKEELLKKQTPTPTISAGSLENFRIARARLVSRNCIPFLGSGVYGQGPLSSCALRKSLGDESCQHCGPSHESCQKSSLATVAEFYYPSSDRNDLFLPELKKIIDDQVGEAKIPLVYNLVKQIKPPLIVSTNLDLLLETTLWDEGKQRCLILCHAIRSKNKEKGAPKGILIFNGPQDISPQVYPANAIPPLAEEGNKTIEQWDYIVYKPLGSPQLPSKEIDTVVITEEDYQILLKLLGSTETGVPAAFTTCFRNYPPIFLGYPMDVWHYRLMGQFFKSISLTDNVKFAVGLADLPLEQKAWKGLNVNLVSMDLRLFSEKVMETLPKDGVTP